ncbi:MAG: ABC-type transport auxiliary lipoprotein family protein [Desulfobaccales bacterium]
MNIRATTQGSLFVLGLSPWERASAVIFGLLGLLALVLAPACGGSPTLINRFILDYPPPVTGRSGPVDAAVRVELFAADEVINRMEMVYRETPVKTGVYQYNRWRTTPGYLVTDYLVRDLRHSGLFKAVFSSEHTGPARFQVEGGVAEFQENNLPEPWQAALTINITLLDLEKENIPERVLFQRTYQTTETMTEKTPQGLAEAMSRAMQKLTGQIIQDIYRAVKQRLAREGGATG